MILLTQQTFLTHACFSVYINPWQLLSPISTVTENLSVHPLPRVLRFSRFLIDVQDFFSIKQLCEGCLWEIERHVFLGIVGVIIYVFHVGQQEDREHTLSAFTIISSYAHSSYFCSQLFMDDETLSVVRTMQDCEIDPLNLFLILIIHRQSTWINAWTLGVLIVAI